jgi:transcriptional regulator with XRE-family HTH domain
MNDGSRKELIKDIISDKEFRHFWNETYLRQNIPFQMKTMRTERGLRQIEAAAILGKGQNGLSRLESPAYGRLTLQSLLEVARGYDVGLIVKFVPFSSLLREYEDVSFNALSAPSPDAEKFPNEIEALNDWADENKDEGFWENGESESASNVGIISFDLASIDTNKNPNLPGEYQRYLVWKQMRPGELENAGNNTTTSENLILV